MVVICAPSACSARIEQDFTARPFMWTVQAPHWAVSQPTWVPVRAELLANQLHQQGAGIDREGNGLAVHRQVDGLLHVSLLVGFRGCAVLRKGAVALAPSSGQLYTLGC